MSLEKRGKYFHYRFMLDGRLFRGSTKETNIGKARQFEATLITDLRGGKINPHLRRGPVLRDFAPKFLKFVDAQTAASHLDADTRRTYHNGWRLLSATAIEGMRIDQIGTADAAVLSFPGSPSNANQALRTLSRILSYACEVGVLKASPKVKLHEEEGRVAIIEPWLEDLLIRSAPAPLRYVIITMLDTGARPEEVCRMRWEHVQWGDNAILIPHGKSLKARRFVGMTERVRDALQENRTEMRPRLAGSPWVFPSWKRKDQHIQIPSKCWRETLAKVRAAAPVSDDLVLYSCRHTYATNYLRAGGDVGQLSRLMGHADISTTMKYVHLINAGESAALMDRHNNDKRLRLVEKRA